MPTLESATATLAVYHDNIRVWVGNDPTEIAAPPAGVLEVQIWATVVLTYAPARGWLLPRDVLHVPAADRYDDVDVSWKRWQSGHDGVWISCQMRGELWRKGTRLSLTVIAGVPGVQARGESSPRGRVALKEIVDSVLAELSYLVEYAQQAPLVPAAWVPAGTPESIQETK